MPFLRSGRAPGDEKIACDTIFANQQHVRNRVQTAVEVVIF